MIEFSDGNTPGRPSIKVVGVGGGGGNAVNTMIDGGVEGVDFIVANTDCQVLEASQAALRVQLGKALTKGLGAGANPEIGRAAALEDASRVAESLAGADMVFVTCGMGGGTGTGAAPVIAQVARDMGALTVGVCTRPFAFEGSQRKKRAAAGIAELAKAVDALIVIPNDRLIGLAGDNKTVREAFSLVDSVLLNAVRGISDLVTVPGLINVDFADVRTIMTGMGRALMGTGRGVGAQRSLDAARQAISSPLLEDVSIDGATGILINITGGPDLTLAEMNVACSLIEEAADPEANIIFGSVIDANCGDEVRITVIATGFQTYAPVQKDGGPRISSADRGRRGSSDQMALPMQPGAGAGAGGGAGAESASAGPTPVTSGPVFHPVLAHLSGAQAPMPISIASGGASPAPSGPRASAQGAGGPTSFGSGGGAPHPVTDAAARAWTTAVQPAAPAVPVASGPPRGAESLSGPIDFDERGAQPTALLAAPPSGPQGQPMAPSPSAPLHTVAPATAISASASTEPGWPAERPSGERITGERPIIRPQISAAAPLGMSRRTTGPVPILRPEDLGVEENEFDKPAYLRRGLVAPGE